MNRYQNKYNPLAGLFYYFDILMAVHYYYGEQKRNGFSDMSSITLKR